MNCPNCRQENPQNANFCHNCGHLLRADCPRCHTPIISSAHYCHHCGLPVSPQSQAAWWPATPAHFPQTPAQAHLGAPPPFPPPVSSHPPPGGLLIEPPAQGSPDGKPALDRFIPRELAGKLETARMTGSMVGERRVVTMLFCDVQGSTAVAENLDPEEWTDIINGAFEHMIKPVYKYEGTVARLMGDAILAFFGAPLAHEDDPQRAVLTGLDIVERFKAYQEQISERYGFIINVRVGINTGLVVVGAVGSDLRMEYTAMGDAINLAARMEQTAEPGTVQIAEATYRLVSPIFDLEALGAVTVKGKDEPVPAYRVLGRKVERENLRGIEGMRSPLIGRQREMNTLQNILERTRQGLGHIVCLTGDAGLGKSRLIEEAHNYWKSAAIPGTWQAVNSFSYETNHAYGLFQRLIRRLNQIGVTDSPAILRRKLEPTLSTFAEERRPRIRQIFETMFALESESNLPRLEGETFRQELLTVMLQIWQQRFKDQPAVLVFDDLHWSDPASVQLLTHLLAATDSIPLVIICSFRPDPQAPSAGLQTAARENFAHRCTEIQLSALADEDINAILDELLAIADLPDQLRRDILDRAGGNPFFVEEVVRSLVLSGAVVAEERLVDGRLQQVWRAVDGVASMAIPGNLQGLLAARIDQLEENIRATLQLASVIGRSFFERVLAEMETQANGSSSQTTRHLRQLLQLQMIQEAARIPEVEYIFRNPLTQEVAYNGILLKHRRDYHNRVGLAMEVIFSAQLTEMAPRLAFHFQEARRLDKAFHYYLLAGNQARLFYAHQEALAHYDHALALVNDAQPPGEQIIQLYLDRGRVLEHSGQFIEAYANYQELGNLAQKLGNQEMRLQALIAAGTIHAMQTPLHDYEIAQKLVGEGLALAEELDHKAGQAKIYWNLMQLERFRAQGGDIELAISHGEHSLKLARELNLREQMALTLNDLSSMYRYDMQFDKGDAAGDEARELFFLLGNLPMLADTYSQLAFFLTLSGRYDDAEKAALEARQISTEIGNLWNQGTSAAGLGFIELERGHLGAAFSILTTALNQPGMARIDFITINLNLRLSEVFIEAGALLEAEASAEATQVAALTVPFMSFAPKALLARIRHLKDPHQASVTDLPAAPEEPTHAMLLDYFKMYERLHQIELALALKEVSLAVQIAEKALAIIERFDFGTILPLFCLLLARGRWELGEEAAAREVLAKGEARAREMGSLRLLWPILAHKLEWETSVEVAGKIREEVTELLNYIADNAGELRPSFLNRPDVKQLLSGSYGS